MANPSRGLNGEDHEQDQRHLEARSRHAGPRTKRRRATGSERRRRESRRHHCVRLRGNCVTRRSLVGSGKLNRVLIYRNRDWSARGSVRRKAQHHRTAWRRRSRNLRLRNAPRSVRKVLTNSRAASFLREGRTQRGAGRLRPHHFSLGLRRYLRHLVTILLTGSTGWREMPSRQHAAHRHRRPRAPVRRGNIS